jgi:hypothetical protein
MVLHIGADVLKMGTSMMRSLYVLIVTDRHPSWEVHAAEVVDLRQVAWLIAPELTDTRKIGQVPLSTVPPLVWLCPRYQTR